MNHDEQVRALFDGKSGRWQAKYEQSGALVNRLERFARAVGNAADVPASVFELGCGSGELSRVLARAGYLVTASDVSEGMLAEAARAPQEGVTWVTLDAGWRRLPFDDERFDVVVASSVFEYLDAPARVFADCRRVLRPGGQMLITVPNPKNPVRVAEAVATRLSPTIGRAFARSGRVTEYLRYLALSKNRLSLARWKAVAASAGLIPAGTSGSWKEPLSLLTFRRPV